MKDIPMYNAPVRVPGPDYVSQYASLVRRMAHHLVAKLPASVQLDDIVQAGMLGLMDAASRYEDGHGASFETFASPRIRGAMIDELRSHDWMPRGVRRAQKSIERAMSVLEQKLKRAPSEAEIAAEMKLKLAEYHELLNEARGAQLFYYDELSSDDNAESFVERSIACAEGDPLAKLRDKRFGQALADAIGKLPEREKTLMGLYYEKDLNFREIAAVFGVSESRVCQLHSQAVARLRSMMGNW
jgi:RNA polymerase sigma factor for flagellar operon FliA